MAPSNNPIPQPTEGGEELTDLVHRIFMAGYKSGKQPTGLQMVIASDVIEPEAVKEVQALIDAARNQGHAAQFAKDQAEIWPEAYQEGFVDGRLVENEWWLERSLVPIIGTTYPNRFRARIAELKKYQTEETQPFVNTTRGEEGHLQTGLVNSEQPAPVDKSDKEKS